MERHNFSPHGAEIVEAPPPVELRVINPAEWEGKKAPPRRWDVPDYIHHGSPALLYADGGTGKGYLGLQLAMGRALAREWIGLMPEPGRTLVLSTEDDADEMWRRIEGMLPFYSARMAGLGDIRLIDLVGENSVLGLLSRGIIEPTPMYDALDRYMTDFKPGMVILDVLADLFSGEENNRPQVTQFMGLLKRLGRKHDCTPLLSAQPSITGINTGTGTSGSTGWNNSGRARMYFQTVKTSDGNEPNKDLRTFEGMKNNYGVRGGKFDLEWKNGLFRRVAGPVGFEKMAREQKLDETFLTLLKRLTLQNRPVRATNSKSGAPSLFVAEPDNGGFTAKDFEAAMLRLLKNRKIANELETEGPPSKRINRLVIKGHLEKYPLMV
jgi:RecA-family ATPase